MTIRPTNRVFTLDQRSREAVLLPRLVELVAHHRAKSAPYARILDALGSGGGVGTGLAGLPWLPVRLFKQHRLVSVDNADVFRTVVSSGTTGELSRIFLDKRAAAEQQRAVSDTLRAVLGTERLPMLLVDTNALLDRSRPLSARGAGILGFMGLGRDHTFVLDEREQPNGAVVRDFLARHGGRPFLIFGFTFMVWIHLYELARDERMDLSNGILIHSGGWKRLTDRAVHNAQFRQCFAAYTGLTRIHNYYGMVEQLGTLYLEGPGGESLYCPDFADVIVRDPQTWAERPVGVPGVIEVISTLPFSYPGNVLLTEDLGVVHGIDDGDWPGKRFSVLGRVPAAEARGCSDTARVDR
ncbi:MAG: acyl-protein synthetase [Pseudonocardiaceae bacterium]